jgi:hypothetical protein
MVQTLLFLTQMWRGNVDVKPLLYQSDPLNPDTEDIVTCSDYLVGYQMKGAHTLVIEKNMKDMVMNMEDMYGNKEGVFSAARKLLNRPRLTELYQNRSNVFAGTATTDFVFGED